MRHPSSLLITGFALAALTLTTVSAGPQNSGGSQEARKIKNPVPASAASVAAGEAAFKKYCAFCHGADAKGNGPMAPKGTHPPDLTDTKWDRGATDAEIFAVIQNGAGPKFDMKGFKGKMPDKDMWQVVNYVRSLGPKAR